MKTFLTIILIAATMFALFEAHGTVKRAEARADRLSEENTILEARIIEVRSQQPVTVEYSTIVSALQQVVARPVDVNMTVDVEHTNVPAPAGPPINQLLPPYNDTDPLPEP